MEQVVYNNAMGMFLTMDEFLALFLMLLVLGMGLFLLIYYGRGPALSIIKGRITGRPLVSIAYPDRFIDIQVAKRGRESWIVKDADGKTKRVIPVPEMLYLLKGPRLPFGLYNPWSLLPINLEEAEIQNEAMAHGVEKYEQEVDAEVPVKCTRCNEEWIVKTKVKAPALLVKLGSRGSKPVSITRVFKTSKPMLSDTFESILVREKFHTYMRTISQFPPARKALGFHGGGMGLLLLIIGMFVFIIIIAVIAQGGGLEGLFKGGGPLGGMVK